MSSNLLEPPDDGDEEDQAKKKKGAWSRHAAATRARSAALLGNNYDYLRSTCPQLPQAGYLPRAKILEGAVAEIRSLQGEI